MDEQRLNEIEARANQSLGLERPFHLADYAKTARQDMLDLIAEVRRLQTAVAEERERIAARAEGLARDFRISAGMEQEDGDSHGEEFFAGQAHAMIDFAAMLRTEK